MEFVCRIGTPEGRILEETHSARDERTMRAELERRGFHVFEVRQQGLAGRLALPRFGKRKESISHQALQLFNQELAALLRSGLPIVQALEVLVERQREPFFKEVLEDIREQVRTGKDLSEAIDTYPDVFPKLYAPTLLAGERTGELETVIQRFVRYQQLLGEARSKVVSALVYPAVLVALSCILIGVMTIWVVPKFTEFFDALDAQLPLITRMTLAFSGFVTSKWPILLAAAAGIWIFFTNWRRSEAGRLAIDRLKLQLPILGDIFERLAFSEFSRSLSTLLAGGMPMVVSLESAVGAVGNAFIRKRLEPLVGAVKEGSSLHEALTETEIVPDITVDMVKVGESTGALDEMLTHASDFLDQEVDTRMQRLLSLLEPVMLVFMGTIVALLLVSVYLPLFSLLGEVRQ
jgi:type IV pilus assembly protein PilC